MQLTSGAADSSESRSDKQPCRRDGVDVCFCVCVLLLSRKGGKNRGLFFYPHRPFTETQRQSLDWAPDGGFINCNKWRQNASSCPRRLGMDVLSGSCMGDIWQGLHAALSSLSCRDFSCSVIYHQEQSLAYNQIWCCQIFNCIFNGLLDFISTNAYFHYGLI